MQNRSTRRPSPLRSVRPGASWALASGSIRPRIPVRAAIALDSGDPPLRADSLRSPALRCVSPLSPEPTGCDKAPKTLEGREVATAPYHPHGTGKSSCRAPARIVDAAQEVPTFAAIARKDGVVTLGSGRARINLSGWTIGRSIIGTTAQTPTRRLVPLYRVNNKSRGWISESAYLPGSPDRYRTSSKSRAYARTALIRSIGTPLGASGLEEYPLDTSDDT